MIHRLTEEDWAEAMRIAKIRHRSTSTRPDADVLGALGEIAFARLLGLLVNDVPGGDPGYDFRLPTGLTIDVKAITDEHRGLLVPKQARAGAYVLALVDYDSDMVEFVGWTTGGTGVQIGTASSSWSRHYLVDRGMLWPIETLKERIDS